MEQTSVDMEPEVAHEVPKEDAAIMPVGEPRKRRGDRNLAAERRQKKQHERTQSKDGCRKNLIAARRGMTRRAKVTRQKGKLFRRKLNQGPYEPQKKKKKAA
jgi:hypothetical protein